MARNRGKCRVPSSRTQNQGVKQMDDELHRRVYENGENITAIDWMTFYQMYPSPLPQKVRVSAWNMATANDHVWELWVGVPFNADGIERDRLAMCLICSMGLHHFVQLLPESSRDALRRALDEAK